MRVSISHLLILVMLIAAFAPMASAVQLSGSSNSATMTFIGGQDIKWKSVAKTPDAVVVGGHWVWTYVDAIITHWGSEPTPNMRTTGADPGTARSAYVRAENDEEEALDLTTGWSFYSSGEGGSVVQNAVFLSWYTVKLEKLVIDHNGSTTTQTDVVVYNDWLQNTMSLPHGIPPSDGAEFTPTLQPGEYYQITATGSASGSWDGQNSEVSPTSHRLTGNNPPENGVKVDASIEIDIATD